MLRKYKMHDLAQKMLHDKASRSLVDSNLELNKASSTPCFALRVRVTYNSVHHQPGRRGAGAANAYSTLLTPLTSRSRRHTRGTRSRSLESGIRCGRCGAIAHTASFGITLQNGLVTTMVDEDSSKTIKLKGSDSEREFEIAARAASVSEVVRNSLGEDDENELAGTETIDLSRVSTACLEKIVEFMVHHDEEEMNEIPTPLGGNSFNEIVEQEWYRTFMENLDRPMLFDVLTGANFMGIKPLLDLACLKVTFELTGKVRS